MKSQKVESCLSVLILLVIAGIATGVFIRQSRYEENLFAVALSKPAPSTESLATAGFGANLEDYLPAGMIVLTPREVFGPENLSEKVNGKAEFYLSAGFLGLRSQRFAEVGKPDRWLELFVYDMGNRRNAFSVFSTQRRADAQDAAFSPFAYHTENASFFQQGQYYVEIIAASDQMREMMIAIAERFIRDHPSNAEGMSEVALFPPEALVPGSIALLAENVFGFDRLNDTFVARYSLSGAELTAFLAHRQSEQEAKELASTYHQFLVENGGQDATLDVTIRDAYLVKVFDTFELVFVHEDYLAGVHEGENKALVEELASSLKKALAGAAK